MGRLFLSGQTTCALLLGAGLLLRAQAALQAAPEPVAQQTVDTPATRPSEMFEDHLLRARTPHAPSSPRAQVRVARVSPRAEQSGSQVRKGFAHHLRRAQGKRCGRALAQRSSGSRCG